jgi:arylsulfatase A-like enzyme
MRPEIPLTLMMLNLMGCTREIPKAENTARADAPNVLLVSIDTLRRDHLASYGYARDTAPALTRIAQEGAQFENAYSMAPATDGSHASLFTGRTMSEHGKFSHLQRLAQEELTLAELFKDNGYRTFGYTSSVKFNKKSGFGQGFDSFEKSIEIKNQRSRWALRQVVKEIDKQQEPWFGFLHTFDPHAPYAPPKRYRNRWHPPSRAIKPQQTTRFIRKHRRRPKRVSKAQLKRLIGLYDAGISFTGFHMTQVRAAVEAGPTRPTLLVVTSDHGEAFHEHGYLGHDRYLYEEIMQVPLLFWMPGTIAPNTHLEQPIGGIDVFPTIAELAGIALPDNISGRSHAPALRGESVEDDPEEMVLMQSTQRWAIAMNTPTGRFKYTRHMKGEYERLVKLDVDPTGKRNVIKEYPTEHAMLFNRLASFEMQDAQGRSLERDDIDAEELEALKAIGYVE